MLAIATAFRDLLIPLLGAGTALLLTLLALLVVQRLVRMSVERWRARVADQYLDLLDDATLDADDERALARLVAAPRRHRRVIGARLLSPLRVLKGDASARARRVAQRMGLSEEWRRDLQHRHWWVRAEAALALGLTRDPEAVVLLLPALDDTHQQVRAAAIDALGRIGDPRVIPELLRRLPDRSRQDHVRLVEAMRSFGNRAAESLLQHAAAHPHDRGLAAEMLTYIGGSEARTPLLEWSMTGDPATRAAAWRALATIGLDDRAFYHALRALSSEDVAERAAAARAVGRSGRADAASHLAARLDDEWSVAAEAARSLARLGAEGLRRLQERADGPEGIGRELARQLAWESARR